MMKRMALPALAVILGLSAIPAWAGAQTQSVDTTQAAKDAKTPKDVDVEADQMEVLDKESKAIFKGNVIAKRDTTTLKCDTLVVTYQETQQTNGDKKTEVTFLDATGNTVIVTNHQTISGDRAHMDVKANTITVEGGVKVVQGKTVINGQKLFSDLNSNKSEMSGGRVKGSFAPQQ